MGLNKPVDFSTAKLLKEKGFSNHCSNFYTNPRCKMFGIDEHGRYYFIKNKAKTLWISGNAATLDSKHVYYAPTISEAVMWLYENHGIWISVYMLDKGEFHWETELNSEDIGSRYPNYYKTPSEAYEAGIEHIVRLL